MCHKIHILKMVKIIEIVNRNYKLRKQGEFEDFTEKNPERMRILKFIKFECNAQLRELKLKCVFLVCKSLEKRIYHTSFSF